MNVLQSIYLCQMTSSNINNLVLVVPEQSTSPYMPALWWLMPSYPPSQILPLMLAFNFRLGALSLGHFPCLEKPSWYFKHKHVFPIPSSSHCSYGFLEQGMTSWFTPQLLLVVRHLSKKDRTSKQRCATSEDRAGPCKPLPAGNGYLEHFISKWGRQPNSGSLTCAAIHAELQRWGYLSVTPTINASRKSSSGRALRLEWVKRLSFVVLICFPHHWQCYITHTCSQGLFQHIQATSWEVSANTLNLFWGKKTII